MPKEKVKIQDISITQSKGNFLLFKKPGRGELDFKKVSDLRQLFSHEKARIIDVIKTKNPTSLYDLSKTLGRNFKSVNDDVKLLKKFGIIDLIPEQTKKRKRLKPVVVVDTLKIQLNL
jgi:predicted transcriptional regulator